MDDDTAPENEAVSEETTPEPEAAEVAEPGAADPESGSDNSVGDDPGDLDAPEPESKDDEALVTDPEPTVAE